MNKFNLRYFLTRFSLAGLLTLGLVFLIDRLIVQSRSEVRTFHSDVSTTDPKVAEKAYWDSIYDYHQVVKHSKYYRFGKLISETNRYMDGKEVTEGIDELALRFLEIAAIVLVFVMMFFVVPVFLRQP